MNADQWRKIEQIFDEALLRKPEERDSFLKETCVGESVVYDNVKALLASHEKDDEFFEDSASALAAEMFADRVGETIGPYEVLSELGSGAMGVVYLAQDARLGRKIALKILPSQFTHDKDRLRRFQQEARAASALNHPNILTVHEVEQRSGLNYIATEFVDGVTLRQHMNTRRMSLDEVLNIAIQVASALQAAHAAGIAHRDIKPENIMIRSDAYIKVLDFGLAKLAEKDLSPAAAETNPGVVMGTPRYMSPEQARGLDVDLRTDIFSLGTVVYEMVTGKVPFDGRTTTDVIAALIKDEPESMALSVPGLPSVFEQVVNKALTKDLDLRYQTITEFLSDLQRLKNEIQLDALVRTNSDGSRFVFEDSSSRQTTRPRGLSSTDPHAQIGTKEFLTNNSNKWTVGVSSVLLVVVATIAIAAVVSLNRRKSASTAKISTPSPLNTRDGFISAMRFAPDGKRIIYSAGIDGKPLELFSRDVQGSEPQSYGIQSAALKSVSRSGKIAVLFDFELSWADGYNGALAIIPAEGGKPEIVVKYGVNDAAFAPDGSLAIIREQQLEYPVGTVLCKSPGWMSDLRFSPKGDKIAFFEHPIGDFSGSIAVFDLASQKKTYIDTDWKCLKGLAWNPKNDDIWFGGSKVGRLLSINVMPLSGPAQMKVWSGPGLGVRVDDISDDGKMLITQGSSNHTTMMILEDGKAPKAPEDFAWSTSADISADGKVLLYYDWGYETSNQSGENAVYLRKLDTSERVPLGLGKALALSPDGKWALALQLTSRQPQLVLLSTSPGVSKTLQNHGIKEYDYAAFFPDGRQILFTGIEAREGAVIRSYVQDVNTGEVHPLTEEGTIALRVSPDGKRVITLEPDKAYYIQPLDGGELDAIPGLESDDEPIQWSDDGQAVYVLGPGEFAKKIYRVNLATGERREWKNIDPSNKVGLVGLEVNPGGILITPDGKVCVYTYWILLQQILTASIN